ncbi:hypothetical protein Taro_055343 [Colocasia esculenta]|uniref:Uncharacterized protein n=1 Tax=Colocasia esculenta TaxID=4460 RepID=A0A843XT09_COLES|nr:hypothetical protein [Colocasia esculenta]
MKLSLGSPKKPPKVPSSWFSVDASFIPVLGKPSPRSRLPPSSSGSLEEAFSHRIQACQAQFSLTKARVVWRRSWQLGKQEIPTPSHSSSPVSSAATCTDHHLEVDQRIRD